MTTSYVTTDDGVRLAVERWPARRPGAPVVLGLHGITATRIGMVAVAKAFEGDAEFVSFDCRGRGLSDKPADPAAYGMRRHAEDAARVLESLGVSDVVVVGQSMGAWVGEQLAAHHPSLVRGLVFGDGGFFTGLAPGETAADRIASIMGPQWLDRLRLTFPSRDVVLGAFRGLPAFADWWNTDVEDLLNEGLVDVEGGVRSRCSDLGAEYDSLDYFRGAPYVKADLALVSCPAHLVRAEFGFAISPDTMTPMMPLDAVEEFQAALPQLTVETVPGSNHYSVNFAPVGAAVIADAVRKLL
jgi:pimeloyl-ACP methyl ester carboxylesterase